MVEAEEKLYVDVPETNNHAVCGELSPYDIDDSGPSALADDVTRNGGPTLEARQPAADVSEPEPHYDEPARGAGQRDDAVPNHGARQSAPPVPPARSRRAQPDRAATRQTVTVAKRRAEPLRPILPRPATSAARLLSAASCPRPEPRSPCYRRGRIRRRVLRRLGRLGRTLRWRRVSKERRMFPELLVSGAVPVVFSFGTFAILGTWSLRPWAITDCLLVHMLYMWYREYLIS